MRQDQHLLSGNDILYKQSHAGKRTVIKLIVPKTLQTELIGATTISQVVNLD